MASGLPAVSNIATEATAALASGLSWSSIRARQTSTVPGTTATGAWRTQPAGDGRWRAALAGITAGAGEWTLVWTEAVGSDAGIRDFSIRGALTTTTPS